MQKLQRIWNGLRRQQAMMAKCRLAVGYVITVAVRGGETPLLPFFGECFHPRDYISPLFPQSDPFTLVNFSVEKCPSDGRIEF